MIKIIKNSLLLLVIFAAQFTTAMEQSAAKNTANCCNSACTEQAKNTCSTCKSVRYCGKNCQVANWTSQHKHICKLIKSCIENIKIANEGLTVLCDNEDKNTLEVIQVALGNKPIAFFTFKTSNKFNLMAPQFVARFKPNDKIIAALQFAQLKGAIVESYYDRDMNEVKLVYNPENKKAASYFKTNKRSPLEHPQEPINFLLEGIFLGYTEENIKSYFLMQKHFNLSSEFNLNKVFEAAKLRVSEDY